MGDGRSTRPSDDHLMGLQQSYPTLPDFRLPPPFAPTGTPLRIKTRVLSVTPTYTHALYGAMHQKTLAEGMFTRTALDRLLSSTNDGIGNIDYQAFRVDCYHP